MRPAPFPETSDGPAASSHRTHHSARSQENTDSLRRLSFCQYKTNDPANPLPLSMPVDVLIVSPEVKHCSPQ